MKRLILLIFVILILYGCQTRSTADLLKDAQAKEDPSYCAQIDVGKIDTSPGGNLKTYQESMKNSLQLTYRDSCYILVAELRQDIQLCDKASANYMKVACITAVAKAKKDATLCNTLPNEEFSYEKDTCYKAVGIASTNPEICNQISTDNLRRGCYDDSVETPDQCAIINDNYSQSVCIIDFANERNDLSVCNYVSGLIKDSCIGVIARNMHDRSICLQISDNFAKASCTANVK